MISVLHAKGYHDFSSKLFCLTIPKNFGGEPSGFSENLWYRKFFMLQRVMSRFSIFCQNFFRLTVPKISVGEPFSALEGYITIFGFLSNFFASQCRNDSQVNPSVLCFRNLPVAKKFR